MYREYKVEEQLRITSMFSLFEYYYDSSYSFSGEVHDFWECVYVINGGICASGDERVYSLREGDMIVHKPLELHKFHIDCSEGAHLLIFSFSAAGAVLENLKNRTFHLSEAQKNVIAALLNYARSEAPENPDAYRTETIYLVPFDSSAIYPQTIAMYICRLLLMIGDSGKTAAAAETPDTTVFRNAVTFMNNHIYTNPSVNDVADFCRVSLTSLKRIFKKFAGMGIHKYFLQLKFKAAAEMLADGTSVTEAAEILGFNDQGYFSKAFKREMGMAPSKALYTGRITDKNTVL